MNEYLRKQFKLQMLKPMTKCELFQAYCRYAIPAYCLIEHNRFGCEYSKVLKKSETFKQKGGKDEPNPI